jgi:hypothetical protein
MRRTYPLGSLFAFLTMVPILISLLLLRLDISTDTTPEFRVFPYENANLEPFETAVAALNPVVAVKVRSAAVHAALAEVCVSSPPVLHVYDLVSLPVHQTRNAYTSTPIPVSRS